MKIFNFYFTVTLVNCFRTIWTLFLKSNRLSIFFLPLELVLTIKKFFKDSKSKWRVFLFFKRKISTKADVYISKKQTRSYSFYKTNFLLRLLWQNSRVYFKRIGKKEIFFRGVWTYLFEADIVMTVLQVFSHGTAKYFLNLKLIKEFSSYNYHYILIVTDRYTNEKHWRDLFLSSQPRVFL